LITAGAGLTFIPACAVLQVPDSCDCCADQGPAQPGKAATMSRLPRVARLLSIKHSGFCCMPHTVGPADCSGAFPRWWVPVHGHLGAPSACQLHVPACLRVAVTCPDRLKEAPLALKALYDADLVDEEVRGCLPAPSAQCPLAAAHSELFYDRSYSPGLPRRMLQASWGSARRLHALCARLWCPLWPGCRWGLLSEVHCCPVPHTHLCLPASGS
jgi:hypothetical protein